MNLDFSQTGVSIRQHPFRLIGCSGTSNFEPGRLEAAQAQFSIRRRQCRTGPTWHHA
jgi:hypothetical protein